MANHFSRTLACLREDGSRRALGWLVVAALLLVGWGAWFLGARVALYEVTATARVEVSRATHPVQAHEPGRVVRSELRLGRLVQKGEILVEQETEAEVLMLGEEQTKRAALTARLEALRKSIAAEERALALSRQAGRATLEEAAAKRREREVEASYTNDKASRLARLHKGGHLAELEVLQAKAKAQGDKAALETLTISASRLQRGQRTDEGDRAASLEKQRGEVTATVGQLATATASIRRLQHQIERRRIRAPISGRLGGVTRLVPGTYLKEGDQLAAVVPDGQLSAVAEFAPSAVGRIRPGQPARLRCQGFPFTQYGTIAARVSRVATEVIGGAVRVELDLFPERDSPIPLQHGLPAEAEVEVDRVSPAALVLRAAGKLFTREAPAPAAPGSASSPALGRAE